MLSFHVIHVAEINVWPTFRTRLRNPYPVALRSHTHLHYQVIAGYIDHI